MPKRKQESRKVRPEILPSKDENEFLLDKLQNEEDDMSDSDESVYSGLEEEADTDSEEGDEVKEINSEGEEENEESTDADDEDDSEEEEEEEEEEESSDEDELQIKQTKSSSDTNEDHAENEKGGDVVKEVRKKAVFEDVDTSDEEDIRNTVGNIPMEWYKDYLHIGYDLDGNKIGKKEQGDQLDNFLTKMEDPDYWRTVRDKVNMEDIKLTDEEIEIIQRIEGGQYADKDFDPYEPYVDHFTSETMIHPIKDNPSTKRSFTPSIWEHKKVMKIVRAIRNGWIKPKVKSDGQPKYYLIWGKDDRPNDHPMRWAAPKLKLPGHEESYNPPPEYLPTEEEKAAWEALDPEDRPQNYLSQKFDALRKVPGYSNFIQERFERCLDLYLCPRQRKVRLNINPEDLIPKLPRPKDLQPFPTTEGVRYKGHTDVVRCISVDPTGQWLASGSSDNTIRFWEVITGRCMKTLNVEGTVNSLEWNPQDTIPILVAAVDTDMFIINPGLGDKLLCKNIDNKMNTTSEDFQQSELATWSKCNKKDNELGFRLKISHSKPVKQVTWHGKGDYIAAVIPDGESKSVAIHQLSKGKSQCPFKKSKGQIQCVRFHPTRPFFFVATQRYIRVYNLQKQELTKKLVSGIKWISCLDIHPTGDNLIIGGYDKRLCWFDMDLSTKPYKTLRHHKRAIRQVTYHKQYPLFASSSDDGTVIISHGKVFSDLMQNPLIVPLKILRGHQVTNDLGVVDCQFHPHQPWVFSAGADKTIRLFT
ncbi:ribosome biogenesis protein bop1-B-like [Clytia hemisphaerica]|uniref:Ribosome biogenesis protein BOP1 homolog n=1 Tax=Clytia hemisphaerica TaxID=252671 RepID=A0A7M5XCL6_9CNID|eukprot:TCONS_00021329-protein